jgi:TonB family protein
MRWLSLFIAVLAVCRAQERVGNGVSAPVVLQKSEPDYSEQARLAVVDGSVRVSLVVDADGNPTDLKVTRSIGFGLDEKALAAVAGWKFKPGMKEGLAVAVRTSVEVNFRLLDQGNTLHMQSFSCRVPAIASPVSVLKIERPPSPGPDQTLSVTISFDVDDQGVPTNLHLQKVSDAKWENDVIAAVREWRFRPSEQKGAPVSAPCTLSFAVGKAPAPANSYRIGDGVSPPGVVTKVEPRYADEARRARYQGTVVLFVVVDTSGKAREIKVLRPLGLGLDERAIEAVEQWQFRPGMKDGQTVNVQATIEVNFRMLDKSGSGWHLKSFSFRTPENALAPHFMHTNYPEPASEDASVTVSFDIDEHGKPVNLHAGNSSDEKSERQILKAVKDWRFDPGMKDGKPIVVPCTVTVGMGR